MRDRAVHRSCAVGLALAAVLLVCTQATTQEPGPVLTVIALLEPSLTIELSENVVAFHADRGPGVYDADREVEVQVATNCTAWTVNCSASPLVGAAGEMPASRIFIASQNTIASPDVGAGASYESMGAEKLVASGGPQALALANTLRFRLQTEWTDRPGQYTGTVSFTYLATP